MFKSYETILAGRKLVIETGKIAGLANVNVLVNGFRDAAGNALESTIPSYNKNIIVDNKQFNIQLANVSVKGSEAVVRYYCSKNNNVNCELLEYRFCSVF